MIFFFFLASYGEENQIIMISVIPYRKKVLWVKYINIKLDLYEGSSWLFVGLAVSWRRKLRRSWALN